MQVKQVYTPRILGHRDCDGCRCLTRLLSLDTAVATIGGPRLPRVGLIQMLLLQTSCWRRIYRHACSSDWTPKIQHTFRQFTASLPLLDGGIVSSCREATFSWTVALVSLDSSRLPELAPGGAVSSDLALLGSDGLLDGTAAFPASAIRLMILALCTAGCAGFGGEPPEPRERTIAGGAVGAGGIVFFVEGCVMSGRGGTVVSGNFEMCSGKVPSIPLVFSFRVGSLKD